MDTLVRFHTYGFYCYRIAVTGSCKYIMHDFWLIALGLATTDMSYKEISLCKSVVIGSAGLRVRISEETSACVSMDTHTRHLGTYLKNKYSGGVLWIGFIMSVY